MLKEDGKPASYSRCLCPCRLCLFVDETSFYCAIATQEKHRHHIGHHKELPEHVPTRSRHISKEDADAISNLAVCNVSSGAARRVAIQQFDLPLSTRQVNKMTQASRRAFNVGEVEEITENWDTMSPEDRTLQMLNKKTTYCALFHGCQRPTLDSNESDAGSNVVLQENQPVNSSTSPQLWLQSCYDLGESRKHALQMRNVPRAETMDLATFCELSRENVKAKETQQLLVAVAWCTPEGRKIFEAYPDTLFVDGTHKTNKQGFTLITAGDKSCL